ncbi:hypothetical protein APHAL10511_006625 [Amanita phalloides]|nr:hypothetical protein APHAL10511_006625 [Amanita phalloides]
MKVSFPHCPLLIQTATNWSSSFPQPTPHSNSLQRGRPAIPSLLLTPTELFCSAPPSPHSNSLQRSHSALHHPPLAQTASNEVILLCTTLPSLKQPPMRSFCSVLPSPHSNDLQQGRSALPSPLITQTASNKVVLLRATIPSLKQPPKWPCPSSGPHQMMVGLLSPAHSLLKQPPTRSF